MDKQLILKKIQEHYGFKKKVDFAHFLGITPNTLNGWMTRKTYKDHILSAKCTEINSRWISTGEGPMLQKDVESKENNKFPKNLSNNYSTNEKGTMRSFYPSKKLLNC